MTDCVDRQRLILTTIPVLVIVGGVLYSDAALDKGDSSNCGGFVFAGGWILLALSLFLRPVQSGGNAFRLVFDKSNLYKVGAAALVAFAAMFAQRALVNRSEGQMKSAALLFVAAWLLFALTIGYDNNTGKFHKKKLVLAVLGALLISGGMGFLQGRDRKYNMMTVQTGQLSEGNVYGPGLPMFTLGWVLVILAISII